jgi:A/G-specific adenine glycosylase
METSIPLSAEKSQTLHRRLLAWYARAARDLPWRRTGDPYAVWISEIMLQQTQVKTVVPFYERFMERFPDVRSLAESKLDEVLRVWAGLGYYSRARNLHAAARRIVQDYGGEFPDTEKTLRTLPGVGRYTAGAVLSIAFGEDTPVLDGNVMRVLTRLFAITLDPRSTPGQKALWDLAGRLLPPGKGSTWNQALMELGALVCLPENASCLLCPVSSACEAYRRGEVERYPVRAERRKVPVVQGLCSIVRRGGQYLFVQRPEKGLLGGLWEFPTAELSGLKPRPGMVEDFVRETLGLEGTIQSKLGVIRHVFTHRDLRLHLFTFDVTGGRLRAGRYRAHRWVRAAEVKRFPISALTKKVLARLSEERAS